MIQFYNSVQENYTLWDGEDVIVAWCLDDWYHKEFTFDLQSHGRCIMYKILVAAVFLTAFILRIVSISLYPVGFTQDEAALGYDAYSLLTTGKDMWGQSLPLVLRSFGDFKLSAYTYFTIPSVAVFGLNEFAVRLPSAIIGSLAVISTYFMMLAVSKRKDLSLISAVFLALSPWHLPLSRGAFEANLTVFFMSIGVWMFVLGLKRPKVMVLSALAFGLNLFTYHSARYVTPLILAVLIWHTKKDLKKNFEGLKNIRGFFGKYSPAVFVFILFLVALLFSILSGGQRRALDIAIFNPTDNWSAMSEKRLDAIELGLPVGLARVYSNKVTHTTKLFFDNYLNYLSPTFLFIQGAGDASYGMIPGRGVLYYFQAIFLAASLVALFKKPKEYTFLIFFYQWVLLSPIPAALTKGPGFAALRVAVMMPAIQIICAYGVIYVVDVIKDRYKLKFTLPLFYAVLIILLLISFSFFAEEYIFQAPLTSAKEMQYGTKELVNYVVENENKYDKILFSRSLSVPHIWPLFYKKIDPHTVQENSSNWSRYEDYGYVSLDQLAHYTLDNYIFSGNYVLEDYTNQKLLYIGKPDELGSGYETLKIIYYPSGESAYNIYNIEKRF